MCPTECFLSGVAFDAFGAQINQQNMGICTMGNSVQTAFDKLIRKGLSIFDYILDISLEFWFQSFTKGNSFRSNHVHQGAALNTWEDSRVEFLGQSLIVGYNHTAPWAAQCFVSRRCRNMRIRKRAWMFTGRNKACKMCHINVQICTNAVCNFAHTFKINLTWDGRTTSYDQLWLVLHREVLNLIVIEKIVFFAHTILDWIEPFSGLVWSRTV